MDQPDREAERQFAQPYRQILAMIIVLALVGAGAYLAYPQVAPVFLANPYLNGFIESRMDRIDCVDRVMS